MDEALDTENNQPNILSLKDDDEDDPHHQFFIAVEQVVMLESPILHCCGASSYAGI